MVVVKFLVFVSEVVSIFSKIFTWIIGGQKDTFAPPTQLLGGRVPRLPPKSTPMPIHRHTCLSMSLLVCVHDGIRSQGRQSWGGGVGRDPPDFGQGVVGIAGGSWTGLEILYLI